MNINSHLPKNLVFICFNETLSKMMIFISSLKLFSFLKYLIFRLDIFGYERKRPKKKAKISFKINDAIHWETNNYNTYIDDAMFRVKINNFL